MPKRKTSKTFKSVLQVYRTYLSPTLMLLTVPHFNTLGFTKIRLVTWHSLCMLSTATLLFHFLGQPSTSIIKLTNANVFLHAAIFVTKRTKTLVTNLY